MASVPVTIDGVLYDKYGRTTQLVQLVGMASLTGLGVGGGPMPGGEPPGIWGPTDPRPTPPIPIYPGGTPNPPGIWGPTDPRPTPPIYMPPGAGGAPGAPGVPTFPIWGPPGIDLPPGSGYPPVAGHPLPPPGEKPPEPIIGWEAKVFWTPENGWGVAIVPKPGTEVPTPSARAAAAAPKK